MPALNTSNGYANGNWTISLTNGLQNAPYVLHIGAGTTNWQGIPLPFDLGVLGATNCFLRVEFPVADREHQFMVRQWFDGGLHEGRMVFNHVRLGMRTNIWKIGDHGFGAA